MSEFVAFALEKVLGEGVKRIGLGPVVGGAVLVYKGLSKLSDDHAASVRDEVRRKLDCAHIEICEGWGPPTPEMVQYASMKKGCAFKYRGIPLWHFQPDLEVGGLAPRVIRYSHETGKVGYYSMPPRKCTSCHPEAKLQR